MADAGFWRKRAPVWLRALLGLLILPIVWILCALLLDAVFSGIRSAVPLANIGGAVIAAILSWIAVSKASIRRSAVLASVILLSYGLIVLAAIPSYQAYKERLPQAEVPGSPGPAEARLPEFPWPPPSASASYVLPPTLFEDQRTVGDAAAAILAALENNGYVERGFFRTEDGGVALVTRLERITSDGYSYPSGQRWPGKGQTYASTQGLLQFLRGLFYVDPGHYRVIVFVLQDLPFSQSSQAVSADEAKAWLKGGANVLPIEIAERDLGSASVTVLIYEFASDGRTVRVIESPLTGKDHLENAGVLAELDTP